MRKGTRGWKSGPSSWWTGSRPTWRPQHPGGPSRCLDCPHPQVIKNPCSKIKRSELINILCCGAATRGRSPKNVHENHQQGLERTRRWRSAPLALLCLSTAPAAERPRRLCLEVRRPGGPQSHGLLMRAAMTGWGWRRGGIPTGLGCWKRNNKLCKVRDRDGKGTGREGEPWWKCRRWIWEMGRKSLVTVVYQAPLMMMLELRVWMKGKKQSRDLLKSVPPGWFPGT